MSEILERYYAEQDMRRQEITALSPGLRRDLQMLCVIASSPESERSITESRGREILACTVTEFRALIQEFDRGNHDQ